MKKNILNIAVFTLLIFGFMIFWIFGEKNEIIQAERRKASPMPPPSSLLSEEFSGEFESYMLDSFPLREFFRKINATLRLDVLRQKDTNGIYKMGTHLSKTDYPLSENEVLHVSGKINEIKEKHLTQNKVYYSIIPDKNYFMADEGGYPHVDYSKMLSLMTENTNAEYIDIFGTLTLSDYYRGDTHWRQECIEDTADTILSAMGNKVKAAEYKENTLKNFKGVYTLQSALSLPGEDMVYLTNEYTDSARVESAEESGTFEVYQTEKFQGSDSYDIFLGGAKAVLDVKRPLMEGEEERHLILFRDSFGSSIAPLFLKSYSHITLVDLRYVSSSILDEFINFDDGDVLFLYNTQILNSGYLLR